MNLKLGDQEALRGANDPLRLGKLLGVEPAAVKTAAKWTLAGILVPVGAGLLVTGGLLWVVVHFLAKWW